MGKNNEKIILFHYLTIPICSHFESLNQIYDRLDIKGKPNLQYGMGKTNLFIIK